MTPQQVETARSVLAEHTAPADVRWELQEHSEAMVLAVLTDVSTMDDGPKRDLAVWVNEVVTILRARGVMTLVRVPHVPTS